MRQKEMYLWYALHLECTIINPKAREQAKNGITAKPKKKLHTSFEGKGYADPCLGFFFFYSYISNMITVTITTYLEL